MPERSLTGFDAADHGTEATNLPGFKLSGRGPRRTCAYPALSIALDTLERHYGNIVFLFPVRASMCAARVRHLDLRGPLLVAPESLGEDPFLAEIGHPCRIGSSHALAHR